jgi:perosamine synthetase
MHDISNNLIAIEATLNAAMQQLDQGVGGVLFCIDEQGMMQGLLTDGDVRRALLKGVTLADNVAAAMNRKFIKGDAFSPRERNLQLLGPTVRHVPLLNEAGQPVDMVSWSEMWSLPVTSPSLAGNELKYVVDCIERVWISSQGDYIDKFQDAFAAYHEEGAVLCTSSGTTALHLALVALGIGAGDEVIVPDISFGASANVVVHAGATPVFVDIDPQTWTLDAQALKSVMTPRTKAIMPVHLYGHPCDMDPIISFAREHGLKIIEDCAEALGAEYKGRKVGLLGDIGCFSFFANKVITTGEGGMVLTKDADLMERMVLYRDHGMSKQRRYWHLVPGYNYRMTNLQAALGLAQMERIEHFLSQRESLVVEYDRGLHDIPGLRTPPKAPWARNIHWLYSIEIDPGLFGMSRDELARRLLEKGIETRPVFPPLHLQPAYVGSDLDFPVARRFSERGLSLPTGNALTLQDAQRVCNSLRDVIKD